MHGFKSAILALAAVALFAIASLAIADVTSTFRTKKNGKTITCGLINGRWVPGSGSSAKFVSTSSSLAKLKKKSDKKSKARVKQLKAYQKFAAAVCRRGPPNAVPTPTPTPSGGLNGQAIFEAKCSCHSKSSMAGRSASSIKSVPGMPSLTDDEAAAVELFLAS